MDVVLKFMKLIDFKKYIYIVLIFIAVIYCIKEALGNGDFKVFLEASKLIQNGENPYHEWIFVSEGNYCLYFYSPLWAVLLIPFTYLPNFIPNIIWLSANLFFLYRIFYLLKGYIDLNVISQRQLFWIILICIMMSVRFILYNFDMIQMTIFLLWAILDSLRLIQEKKVVYGGMLLALVINIKILPIVILPYLLYRFYIKGFVWTLIFSLAFLFLPMVYTGWSTNNFLIAEWWSVINPTNSEHLVETDLGLHSLTALIPNLLTETTGGLSMSRNIVNLNETIVNIVLNIIRVLLVAFSLYFLKLPLFTTEKNRLSQLRELAYIILLIPLIFPHQQKYAFVLIIPSLFYLIHFTIVNFTFRSQVMSELRWFALIIIICLTFMLMTLSTDGLIGRELSNITQHFKTITWGALLLIFALILADPRITFKTKKLQITKPKLH